MNAKAQVASIHAGITVVLNQTKQTTGTVVYQEPPGTPRHEQTFPTIYVQKQVLTDPPPAQIEVTIRSR